MARFPPNPALARRRADRRQLQSQYRRRRRSFTWPTATPCPRACSTTSAFPRKRAGACRWSSRCSNMAAAAAPGACSTSSRLFRSGQRPRRRPRARAKSRAGAACVERGHEIVSHGYRWIDYGDVPEDVEREHIRRAIDILQQTHRRAAGRLDDRAARPEHAAAYRRGGRISVRPRFSRGRAALLDAHRRQAPSRYPVFLRSQRQPLQRELPASRPARIFSTICAMPSTPYREGQQARPSFSRSACMTGLIGRPGRCTGPDQTARAHARLQGRLVLPRHRRRATLECIFRQTPDAAVVKPHPWGADAFWSRTDIRCILGRIGIDSKHCGPPAHRHNAHACSPARAGDRPAMPLEQDLDNRPAQWASSDIRYAVAAAHQINCCCNSSAMARSLGKKWLRIALRGVRSLWTPMFNAAMVLPSILFNGTAIDRKPISAS